jgi:hypothetical protein
VPSGSRLTSTTYDDPSLVLPGSWGNGGGKQNKQEVIEELIHDSIEQAERRYGLGGTEARIRRTLGIGASTQSIMTVGAFTIGGLWAALSSPVSAQAQPVTSRYVQVGEISTAPTNRTKRLQYWHLKEKLQALGSLSIDWDSYGTGPPNANSIELAAEFLGSLFESDLLPDRVVPSAEGGVGFAFLAAIGQADIEIFNDGDVLAAVYPPDELTQVWEASLADIHLTVQRLREFLRR